ncbi:MBL fold metallo-hydrolase [Natronomonas sp. F2-12]|uniref:MBL fold metallo-hydrolase n=1 Tax=Natronomonas aquatica TaxID=2841590 RepID=A0A9R1CQD0_9EURY|nr:MBL fold metallo-hydrolase [Natronomonas aquatica]MCQ4332030.1 MBL fold metallo-hydrolase [Natronomonas aquatica]
MDAAEGWYDVTRLTDRSYRITEAEAYGAFLIEGTERSVLVDAGIGVGDLPDVVSGLVGTPVTLVLSHTHWDHIGAAAGFEDVRVSPAELPADGRVAIDSLSEEFTERPAQFTERWLDAGNDFPDGVDHDEYAIEPADATALPADGSIDLGDRTLEVVPLPGHSPGHVGLLDPATATLYGGDVVHREYGLYIHFEDCDLDAYVESLRRLRELRDEAAFETLATSHNEPLSGGDLSLIDDLLAGLEEIRAGKRTPEPVDTDWGPAHSYWVGDSEVLTTTDI